MKVGDARALLSFFTVLPIRPGTLDAAARGILLLPLVGLVTGFAGAVFITLGYVLPPGVAATLALAAVLLMAGFHHADGVLDAGDALMAHGDPERRRAVLKDSRIGIGGLGALFVVYAPALAALGALVAASPWRAALALICAEVAARSTMLVVLALGEPAEENSSSTPFTRTLTGDRRTAAVALALLIPTAILVVIGPLALLGALAVPLVAAFALYGSRRTFGGISGDLVGASGEVTRMVLLVILSTLI